MDAHLFRRFCEVFVPALPGSRMEKIHQPGSGVTIFSLYGYLRGEPRKRYLVLKAERKSPLIFVADSRLAVNAHPPAAVMRLRKHFSDKRVTAAFHHWDERRLYLEFAGEGTPLLCLDLREGPSLLFGGAPAHAEPLWPPAGEEGFSPLDLAEGDQWRGRPVLTPALRRTLPYLDEPDARTLLLDLQAGGGDVFLYENSQGRREVSAWPLPVAQLKRRGGGEWRESVFEDPLPALALAGESQVYSQMAAGARENAGKPFSVESARLSKLQKKLDQEEERLLALCAKQEDALLLQGQLYRFSSGEKAARVTLDDPRGPRELALDPRLTVRENMARLFHQAGRGRRGLEHLARRKETVAAEKEAAMRAMLHSAAGLSGTAGGAAAKPAKGADPRQTAPGGLPRQVQVFRSSDGFLILRGRDTKGNALALKLASPHDYWLHAAHGPSAHVVIRRDHPGQEVPRRTLDEAGALAALKSRLKDEEKAEIQYSLAKYIHPMKKAAPGTVRIDRSEGTYTVSLDPDLEEKLKKV